MKAKTRLAAKLFELDHWKFEYYKSVANTVLICGVWRFFWRAQAPICEHLLPFSILEFKVIDLFVVVADLLEE
jgi:hypothetical protein